MGGGERMRGGSGGEKMYNTSTPMPTHQLSDSNRRIMGSHNDNRARNLRVYQAWKGNNIFCLGGRLVFGPDVRSLILTILLIMIPVVLFSAFVSQRLIEDFQHQLGPFITKSILKDGGKMKQIDVKHKMKAAVELYPN
ncbi:hypothetical protein NC653_000828 [Populus alba x Populus x berolinensis]|uniref:Uncharacterized protein n=1 Tax=Populus alba x Populus x berolinensis TaxID=444605 RepID=A0AAD6WFA2_9ROSI|nr:hypothetical protein NC653_000828 [Populus alba x Populus x berolinensis]